MPPQVPGFRAAGIACGIKPSGALDLALIVSNRPATVAGVFTTSRLPGPAVGLSRSRVRRGLARAVLINSGIANVATGEGGLEDARSMTGEAARELKIPAGQVLVGSTGVIGRPLPMAALRSGIPRIVRELSPDGWSRAADAIRTTDTRSKLVHETCVGFSIVGIAKGSGMVMPNMATMLAYLVTDLAVEPAYLRASLRDAVGTSFNRLTIDGEMSTSDTVVIFANGAAGNRAIDGRTRRARDFRRALDSVCESLVEKLAADGEGVTKLADVVVTGARNDKTAERVARSVANSLLVKTALFGADPNPGRVVQAVGAAGVPVDADRLSVRIGGVQLVAGGVGICDADALRQTERALRKHRVAIEISLGDGTGTATMLTTDLSYEYVRINAEYTS